MEEVKSEKDDIIDIELCNLTDKISGETADEDDWDDISDLLFTVIGDLVDEEKIEDIPPEEASEDEKKNWIDTAVPIIEVRLKEEMQEEDIPEQGDSLDVDPDLE